MRWIVIFILVVVTFAYNFDKEDLNTTISQIDLNLNENDFALTFLYDSDNKGVLINNSKTSCLYVFELNKIDKFIKTLKIFENEDVDAVINFSESYIDGLTNNDICEINEVDYIQKESKIVIDLEDVNFSYYYEYINDHKLNKNKQNYLLIDKIEVKAFDNLNYDNIDFLFMYDNHSLDEKQLLNLYESWIDVYIIKKGQYPTLKINGKDKSVIVIPK